MKRCNVCREKVYRNFPEHVQMHQQAARRRYLGRHPRAVHAMAMESAEPIGVGTEIRPLQRPGFFSRAWQGIRRFFNGLGS